MGSQFKIYRSYIVNPYISYVHITVTHTQDAQVTRRNDLLWVLMSIVPIHNDMALLLLAWGAIVHHGSDAE